MNRDNQDFHDYQYGNNAQYYHYNNPPQMYYQGYAVQGEYYGPPQQYPGAQYAYGQYADLNYYNDSQRDNYYDTNTYGYEGEVYEAVGQSTSTIPASVTDDNGMRQQTRGKHSYSQNRSRNRQKVDAHFQGGNKTTDNQTKDADIKILKKDTDIAQDIGCKSNDYDNQAGNLTEGNSYRGNKLGGRFYGNDTRSRPFENRNRRQNTDMRRRDKAEDNDTTAEVQHEAKESQNKDEHGAKPKGYRQQTNWSERDRTKYDKYGKENLPERQRLIGGKAEMSDDPQNVTVKDNANNNATAKEYERRSDRHFRSDQSQRKTYERSGTDVTKKEDKEEATFDYRAEGVGQRTQQPRHQRGTTRNRGVKKVDESQRGDYIELNV